MKPYYADSLVALFHGDCRELLASLQGVDLVLTDPPYGINLSTGNAIHRNRIITGDDKDFDPAFLLGYKTTILWGGNNFANRLPVGGWLCWDKRCTSAADRMIGSPFELAWCNDQSKFKFYRVLHGGVVNADGANAKRWHPTQKPTRLFTMVLEDFASKDDLIIDPYAGSGTTLQAAKELGFRAIGIEIEEKYCEITARRCEVTQPALFTAPTKERQEQSSCFQ